MTPDIFVYTDGSGHADGFGGWAAIALTADRNYKMFRMGMASGTSTDRMEFTAILEGLQMALELLDVVPMRRLAGSSLPVVRITSDRENLVGSIMGVNARSNSKDLWERLAYYETKMTLYAVHIGKEAKEELSEFKEVDLQASTGRIIVKSYVDRMAAYASGILNKNHHESDSP